jgi:hypothetical protein
MTDKEQLELAAKAVGIKLKWMTQIGNGVKPDEHFISNWHPLTDDGDALRLAVKLKMEVYHGNDEGEAVYASYVKPNSVIGYCVEYYDDLSHKCDPYAATRRAIVRAAAEIGKNVP